MTPSSRGNQLPTARALHRVLAGMLTVLVSTLPTLHADSATWLLAPTDGNWNEPTNWTAPVPNGPADTATFDESAISAVSLAPATSIEVEGIVFDPGAALSPHTIGVSGVGTVLNITGTGITNNSEAVQSFMTSDSGLIQFANDATAGARTQFTNDLSGITQFMGSSTAGSAIFFNTGDGGTVFTDAATAGSASLSAGDGGFIAFMGDSTGGTALVTLLTGGRLDISLHNGPGVAIGSLDGEGDVFVGAHNLTVGTDGSSSTFSGVIQDGAVGTGGSFTKVGAGTVTLIGASTYTGDTAIEGGSLAVDGSIESPNVIVHPGAMLEGNGILGGNVINSGVVSPGRSVGKLTVNGDYTQNAGGTLRAELDSASSYDQVTVHGAASLDGRLEVIKADGLVPKTGDKFKILAAKGGVNGEFSSISQTPTISVLGAEYRSNSVVLSYLRTQFVSFLDSFGLTPNQAAVARALDASSADRRQHELIDFLLSEDVRNLPEDFDRIAPEELTALLEIVLLSSAVHLHNITDHLADARAGFNGFNSSMAFFNGDGAIRTDGMPLWAGTGSGQQMLSTLGYKSGQNIYQPSPENRWGVWAGGTGEFGDIESDSRAKGFDFQSGGVTIGLDYRVSESFILGVAASYADTGADLIEGGSVDVQTGRFALYGTWMSGGAYVNAVAGGGYHSYDTRRRSVRGFADGSGDGGEFSALLGGGYDFRQDGWTFGPLASIGYTYTSLDGYRERGSLAPLEIQSQDESALRSRLGWRVARKFRVGGIEIAPEVSAQWQHQYLEDERGITATFASGAGPAFDAQGHTLGRDSAILGARLGLLWTPNWLTFLAYEAEIGRDNYESHTVNGGMSVLF